MPYHGDPSGVTARVTLIGNDTSYLSRALRGLRRVLDPRPRPRVRPRRTSVIAHRGDDRQAPENTIAACRLAMVQRADGVEVDVCVTSDGHAVLWHDRNPDSLVAIARQNHVEGLPFVPTAPGLGSGLRRPVAKLTLEEMRSHYGYARVHPHPGVEREERWGVATLAELAAWGATEHRLRDVVLDVKLAPTELDRVGPLLDAVADAQRRHAPLRERSWWLLTAQLEVYEALRRGTDERGRLSNVVVVPDFELPGVTEVARELGARHVGIGINPRRTRAATRDDIVRAVRARERGELDWVLVWSVVDVEVLRELGKLAVDAVLTDDVPLAREILDAEHARHERLLRRRARARLKIPDDKVR